MSSWTKLRTPNIASHDVAGALLKCICGSSVRMEKDACADYCELSFTYKDEKRSVGVLLDKPAGSPHPGDYPGETLWLLGDWGFSVELMTLVAEELSGYLVATDLFDKDWMFIPKKATV